MKRLRAMRREAGSAGPVRARGGNVVHPVVVS